MSAICRLCLRNEEHIRKQNIFDLFLSDTVYWIFGVEVEATDCFSKMTNQYLLKVKQCPLDFDVEFFKHCFDVGTQTDIVNRNNVNKKCFPVDKNSQIQTGRKIITNATRTRNSSSRLHIPIPEDLFNSHFSPTITVPKVDIAYDALGYEYVKPLVYKKIAKERLKEENSLDSVLPQESEYRKKNNIGTNTDQTGSNYISVPRDVFDSFGVPYVQVEKLNFSSNFDFESLKLSSKRKKRKSPFATKKKKKYLDYHCRLPTPALKELTTERDEKVTGKKKVVQERKNLFKIEDVFHVETCEICRQVFKSKERLLIHRDIKHGKTTEKKTNFMLKMLRCPKKSRRKIRTNPNGVEVTNTETNRAEVKEELTSGEEEVDVMTIKRNLRLPDVILFGVNEDAKSEVAPHLIHDHDYVESNPDVAISETDDLYRINKTKGEIGIWERVKDALLDDYTNGTFRLEEKYESVTNMLTRCTEVKEEPVDTLKASV